MQNTKNSNQKALEALTDIITPAQAEEVLNEVFINHVPSDVFCEQDARSRHEQVFVLTSLINFFKNLGGHHE